MKKYLIILVVMLGFVSLAWGGPSVRQVEVVNPSLNVNVENPSLNVNVGNQPVNTNVMNWPDTLDVNIVQSPLDVRVVNQPEPVQYEYFVFETQNVPDFQNVLDEKVLEGYELSFFTAYVSVGVYTTQHYIGIMRRPEP
jgi:hypothetical protein